jgi:iron(III) transport system substrate-binding protein
VIEALESRRRFIAAAGAATASLVLPVPLRARTIAETVTLYSSVDDAPLREIVELAERELGVRIRLVGDTEATKTTGLVQRLIAEREAPKADVWWSSEAMGTAKLARESVLEAFAPGTIADLAAPWPVELRPPMWTGFACRARVLVVNTQRVPEADRPSRLRDLIKPTWKGRVGLAHPAFGTTRGHLAALLAQHGEAVFANWIEGLHANSARIFDGNATVVRACAQGEIDVGLTDTDDVFAGVARGWPVALMHEAVDEHAATQQEPAASGLPSTGPLLIPNTLALVKNGPNPAGARRLIELLLSDRVERAIARSESRNTPVRPSLGREFPELAIPGGHHVDWAKAADAAPRAIELAERLGR